MVKEKLSVRDLVFTGSLLFGLFFGSGNLIFPVSLGQHAGQNFWPALLGMLVSAVGLPLLGVCAVGVTQSNGLLAIASKVGRHFGRIFTVLLYLMIGPLFILPRLADTAFVISFGPYTTDQTQTWFLLGFSLVFLGVAYWLSRKPAKLLIYVGKVLNPLFLLILAGLLLVTFIQPLGALDQRALGGYANHPLSAGFSVGYNTMDLLAALAFGIVIVNAVRQRGVTTPKMIAKETIRAGLISTVLMSVIYGCLAYLGATSVQDFGVQTNGAVVLAIVADHYFGSLGQLVLGALVILACLKTAVGLITSFGETFEQLYPQVAYQKWILLVSGIAILIANVGLDQLITYSDTFLLFMYPLAIALVLSALATVFVKPPHRWAYRGPMFLVIVPAILAAVASLPGDLLDDSKILSQLVWWNAALPLSDYGVGWLFPAILGLLIGLLLDNFWDPRDSLSDQ
ncbi:branched-chain amino acid transport system II carrier protein [Lapidilactobacillus luobeiensis]|uniref:branched-chain amino acid transport system II carrier protein n=1 Tax=Lapidilactobacillus luobeiensis TaxID=2950371 RepID=UPI0021C37AEE|nr:branched-chain amino acid transport system II carrier protein [Lapidilactobacillus luobeiensis]